MKRRGFLHATLAAAIAAPLAAPGTANAAKSNRKKGRRRPRREAEDFTPEHARATVQVPTPPSRTPVELAEELAPRTPWRAYELSTSASLPALASGVALWLPAPWVGAPVFQEVRETAWEGNPTRVRIVREGTIEHLVAEWAPGQDVAFSVRWQMRSRDRHFDLTRSNQPVESPATLRAALRLPAMRDGVPDLPALVEGILGRLHDPVARAHQLYQWTIEHARFVSGTRPLTTDGFFAQLANGALAGNDEDINTLFVLLARGGGIPARLACGWRVDQSAISSSLGQTADGPPSRHCRAEFYAHGYGWIPVDPADVCRASALDGASLDTRQEQVLRHLLFGFWEMNWICLGMTDPVHVDASGNTPLALTPRFVRNDGLPVPANTIRLHARPLASS